MWSGEGGVDEAAGREGRGAEGARSPPDLVSSSTSPSPAAVDLSLKPALQEGRSLPGKEVGEEACPPTSTSSVQTELKEFSSIKEVLLEMTNNKNGHAKLPPAKWGIMKKEAEQVLLKVPKYVVDEKKGAFPRPTAFVNPFPADGLALNGSSIQTSIKDWLNGKKDISPRDLSNHCTVSKPAKNAIRQRIPRGPNGRIMPSRKKPLNTIVAQLAGNIQNSQAAQVGQAAPEPVEPLPKPPTESVSFLSPQRLTGGEVSISEVSPDLSVIDRLKRLGTVIELEEQAEKDSLKLLEKMTKSVAIDVDNTPPVPKTVRQPSKPPNTRLKQHAKHQSPQDLSKSSSLQLTVPSEMPIITLTNVPLEPSIQNSLEIIPSLPVKNYNAQQHLHSTTKQATIAPPSSQPKPIADNLSSKLQASQPPSVQSSSTPSMTIQTTIVSTPSPQVRTNNNQNSSGGQPTNQNQFHSSSQSAKDLPILISLTPKIQFAQRTKTQAKKHKTPTKSKVAANLPLQQSIKPHLSMSSASITTSVYISKDVTLTPKTLSETLQDRIEPSLLEPVIDIVEEESVLGQDGMFIFRTDSFHNIDLPNEQKVYSCDICSAVYTHSNLLRKHYLRLHIARRYISEKDMETFNIDPEQTPISSKDNLIFRCHTCRECFATKNDLRSHLTDHPPVDELAKQANKSHPTYKCGNCSAVFKWRKQFGKHKKLCKSSPPPSSSEKPDLFHCLYCNETFLNANGKRNHILSIHPYVRRKHCCVFCKRDGFPTNVSLFLHLLSAHPTVYFACQLCKERFTHLEDLKAHVDKRHDQDEKLKSSMSKRISTLRQDKEFFSCDTCQRKFLIENSFKEHKCFPEKQEKPKLQKIKRKVYSHSERAEKHVSKVVDLETLFYSSIARNVRDNLLNHLDGKIYTEESSEKDINGRDQSSSNSRTCLNFSDGFPSSSEVLMDQSSAETPTRAKAPWEKYNFPKNYDGRCGLTSYIKDTAYLDISTQLIMRRNLQRLNMLPMKESPSNDVPSAVDLERLGAECAESFGQLQKERPAGEVLMSEESELMSLSGEWVRERMYVCSACHWETPCLWTMEDHKYLAHPRVHCPQHELIGEQAHLSQTIYKRLVDEERPPFDGPKPPPPVLVSSLICTKCGTTGFVDQSELHVHILECAGVVVEAVGPPSKKRRRRSRRRPRRGLKRNIPQTPQKLPPKQRTKPGDTDTIQRMIANLPAKRISRKVLSTFEENKARLNRRLMRNRLKAKKNAAAAAAAKGAKNRKSKEAESRSHSEPPLTPVKDQEKQMIYQKPTMVRKEQDYIDTSAEGGDVLSSLRMMPVIRTPATPVPIPSEISLLLKKEVKEISAQSEDKEMPTLEKEEDISPVESSEIPVLSPVDSTGKEIKKEKDDIICGISFVDGKIKYETVSSVSEETMKFDGTTKKRKSSSSSISPVRQQKKKPCKGKSGKESSEVKESQNDRIGDSSPDEKLTVLKDPETVESTKPTLRSTPPKHEKKLTKTVVENVSEDEPAADFDNSETEKPVLRSTPVKLRAKRNAKASIEYIGDEEVSSAGDITSPDSRSSKSEKAPVLKLTTPKQKTKKNVKASIESEEEVSSAADVELTSDSLEPENLHALKSTPPKSKGKKNIKTSEEKHTDEEVTSAADILSPDSNYSEPEKPSTFKLPSSKTKGKKSTQSVEDIISEDVVSSAADATPTISEDFVPEKATHKSRQRGKKLSKSTESVNEHSTDTIPVVQDNSKIEKTPVVKNISPKQKAKKPKKGIDCVSEEVVSSAADILQQKGKRKRSKVVVSTEELLVTNSDSSTPEVTVQSKTVVQKSKLKGKKNSKDSIESIPNEIIQPLVDNAPLKSNSDEANFESSIPPVDKALPTKPKGKKISNNLSPGRKVVKSALLENKKVIEKLTIKIHPPKSGRIQKGKKKNADQGPIPFKRGPGRPKGAVTKKNKKTETRRSNRRSNGDLSNVQYDEILPCEEDEIQEIVRKPEKPGRKPRTVKQVVPSESMKIVVEVEVHPEPVLKRKIDEANMKTGQSAENDTASKKIKEGNHSSVTDDKIEVEVENTDASLDEGFSEVNNIEKENESVNKALLDDALAVNKLSLSLSEKMFSPLKPAIEIQPKMLKEKKIDIPSLSPNKNSTCYNSPVSENVKKDEEGINVPDKSKVVDVYEFVDYDTSEGSSKSANNTADVKQDVVPEAHQVLEKDISKSEKVLSPEKVLSTPENVTLDSLKISLPSEKVEMISGKDNAIDSNTLNKEKSVESSIKIMPFKHSVAKADEKELSDNIMEDTLPVLSKEDSDKNEEPAMIDVPLKKKKIVKKVVKGKKKVPKKEEVMIEDTPLTKSTEVETGASELNEAEKEKNKKIKKPTKKDLTELPDTKKLKKELPELTDSKKIKKIVKKKKVIKKVVKMKKRVLNRAQKSGKVLNIGGFTWEVSELESTPVGEFNNIEPAQPVPDSSVGDMPLKQEIPDIKPLLPPMESVVNPLPVSAAPLPSTASGPTLTVSAALPTSTSMPPHLSLPPTTPAMLPTWEASAPWEPPQTDTSIGTIIDSVNKLLNEPESAFTPLGLPSYSLADLQKAMGASDAEMAVLQQLGEASLQIAGDGSCSRSTKGCDSDDWNGEKCIMDLDSHTPLQKQPPPQPSSPALTLPEQSCLPDPNSILKELKEEDWRWREKSPDSPVGGSSSLLEAHQGKEVLCPSCSCHFMGFPALQKHLVKAHPSIDPKSKQKRGAGTPFTKTDLNRRMPLDSSKGPRLICFTCQQILPSDRMGLHLDQEHDIAPEEVTKCASLSGSHDGPVIGERLKSKMSLKLGDLLDRAVNNLLQAKHKPNNTLSGGAVELLTKLCAVRKREGSVKHRLHGARELLSKLQRQQEMRAEEAADEPPKVVKKLFSCSICGLKFSLPSSRNKHEVLAHRSYRPVEHELDEYENDWREAPSPPEVQGENGETAITPQCSDCGLSFDSIQEMMRHRVEDHTTRRSSVDTIITTGTGCCPSPVPSSSSRSQPDSEGEAGGGGATDSDAGSGAGKQRGNKFRKHGLSHNGSRLVKERAEAALRELNHPRLRPGDRHRWPHKQRNPAGDIYNFTEDSL